MNGCLKRGDLLVPRVRQHRHRQRRRALGDDQVAADGHDLERVFADIKIAIVNALVPSGGPRIVTPAQAVRVAHLRREEARAREGHAEPGPLRYLYRGRRSNALAGFRRGDPDARRTRVGTRVATDASVRGQDHAAVGLGDHVTHVIGGEPIVLGQDCDVNAVVSGDPAAQRRDPDLSVVTYDYALDGRRWQPIVRRGGAKRAVVKAGKSVARADPQAPPGALGDVQHRLVRQAIFLAVRAPRFTVVARNAAAVVSAPPDGAVLRGAHACDMVGRQAVVDGVLPHVGAIVPPQALVAAQPDGARLILAQRHARRAVLVDGGVHRLRRIEPRAVREPVHAAEVRAHPQAALTVG